MRRWVALLVVLEGQNLVVEYRHFRTLPEADEQAKELAGLPVDVVIAQAPPAILAARGATRTIPIVMMYAGDVVKMGITTNLARPGGNVTGLSFDAGIEWAAKWIQLVHEAFPRAKRIAFLWNLENDAHVPGSPYRGQAERVAGTLGLGVIHADVRATDELPAAIRKVSAQHADVLFVSPDPFTARNRRAIMDLARAERVPAVVGGDWGFEGAVLVYGPRHRHTPVRAAEYVDRILRGAQPGNLPIEQPTEYDLIVDLKAARTFGLTIPPSVLARADQVIE